MFEPSAPSGAPFYRQEPLLLVCFVLLSGLVVAPFWVGQYLPFLDIPQHLMTIAVMHHGADPTYGFSAFYTVEAGSTQYLLYYLTCDLLSSVVTVETANRIFISAYAVLLPWSLLSFLSAWGRFKPAALLAFPLVFNTFLFFGFINYVFAFPFFFFGLAAYGRVCRAPRGTPISARQHLGLGLFALVVFYSHLQVFLVYVGALGLAALLTWRADDGAYGFKGSAQRLAHLAPALGLFAWWGLASDGLAGGQAWADSVSKRYESLQGAQWEPLHDTLSRIPDRLMSVYLDRSDELITALFGFCLLFLLLIRRGPSGTLRRRLSESFPELLTVFVLAFYVAVPTSYKWVWPVNWRFLPLGVLLLLAWARTSDVSRAAPPAAAPTSGWRQRRLTAFATITFAALAAWAMTVHIDHFKAFDQEAREIEPILEAIPPKARVYALMFDSRSKVINGPAYLHFDQYHPIRKGGVAVYSFAEAPQSPVRFRPQREGGPPPTPLRSEWKPGEFRFANGGRYYDYFLVRGARGGWFRRAGFNPREVTRVAQSGRWSLYHYARQ